jgi:hypothetical protein
MSLFFNILSAINDPNQMASVSQLASITNSLQNLTANRGIQTSQMQSIMSVAGELIRPVLQQQQAAMGSAKLENLISQAVNSGASGTTLQSLISLEAIQEMSQTVAQRVGISHNLIQMVMPTVISSILSILSMGTPNTSMWGSNSLLSSFLDSDGDTDLGHVVKFANRFLTPSVA